jgi:DNA polymerase III alpha subunit
MVYQEDVARVAMALAGFTPEQADGLRKIMAKKDRHAKLEDYKQQFFAGARARGVTPGVIESIWEMCLSFTGYSFCKPHSASYVQVSMQSAYLKAYFPAAFMAAVMSNYGGFYTTQAYISEAQRMGIAILGPDVNESGILFSSNGMNIRVGLCQIKGLSSKAMKGIIDERQRGGRYISPADFLSRTEIDESDAENCVCAGACDSLEPAKNRSQLFWQMRSFYQTGECAASPLLKQYSQTELLRAEYAALGFLSACHPITLVKRKNTIRTVKIADIQKKHVGKIVVFLGWCVTAKTVLTKYGEPMQFVTFEDETGICETVLFPEAYTRYVRYLISKDAFYVTGKVLEEFGALTVAVREISVA